jgi:hypothetical protein
VDIENVDVEKHEDDFFTERKASEYNYDGYLDEDLEEDDEDVY